MTPINLEYPFKSFDQHLNHDQNKQILFSAPFGSGKTYFLTEYFKENLHRFNTFKLSPVKYVVSQNEDIFEYIKFDLAYHLLKTPTIQQEIKKKYGESLFAYQYISNNPKDIFKLLFDVLEGVPILGEGIGKIGNSFIDIFDKYKNYKETLDEQLKTTGEVLSTYLDKSISIKGSIYEDDLISQMIRSALLYTRGTKQNVLIIDDLDRLDPEHIFRILNILTVHQDNSDGENKFRFDKIIVVCDLGNIKHIYMHKYGSSVDFKGYIEKFYSSDVFRFTNDSAISLFCKSNLNVSLDIEYKFLLGILLSHFVSIGEITVRSIIKHDYRSFLHPCRVADGKFIFRSDDYSNKYRYLNEIESSLKTENFHIDSSDFDFFTLLKILVIVFGDYNRLKESLSKATTINYTANYTGTDKEYIIRACGLIQILNEKNDQSNELGINYQSTNQSNGNASITLVTWPRTILFDHSYTMELGWTPSNPYTGEKSFYSNKETILKNSIVEVLTDQSNPNKGHYIDSKSVIKMMKTSIEVLESRGLTLQLGIS